MNSANILVHPPGLIRTGQEVLFDASSFIDERPELSNASFEWDFGDTYSIRSPYGGTAVTHAYMYPGDYTVTLMITDSAGNVLTNTLAIKAEGLPQVPPILAEIQPIIELPFEHNLMNAAGTEVGIRVPTPPKYVISRRGKALDLTSVYAEVSCPTLTGRHTALTLSLWAKKNHASDTGCIIDLGDVRLSYPNANYPGRVLELAIRTDTTQKRIRNNWVFAGYDTEWHHYVVRYDGVTADVYVDGALAATGHCSGALSLSGTFTLAAQQQGAFPLNACVDEVLLWPHAIDIAAFTEPFALLHASFHGHTAQYIHAQIPPVFRYKANFRLRITLNREDKQSTQLVCDRDFLSVRERCLLKNAELRAGSYCLIAQLLDPANKIRAELREYFCKPYDGPPLVGIDENNAIRINGELFFPVTPWILDVNHVPLWAGRFINALYGQGTWLGARFGSTASVDAWLFYLDIAERTGLPAIGPATWSGFNLRNSSLSKLREYVQAARDRRSLLAWMWDDEPDLGGETENVIAPVLRAWTYACHSQDPWHLVATNFAGSGWVPACGWHAEHRRHYVAPYNMPLFGGRGRFVADIYGIDYYPIDWAPPSPRAARVEYLAKALDNLQKETCNLVPIMSFVETCDIFEPPYPTPEPPTPEQVRMLAWLNVVHGAKGISWFHHRSVTPTENYGVMQEFLRHITRLTRIVLGPDPGRYVVDSSNDPGNRVDTMVREDEDNILLVAVRLTELGEQEPVTTTFELDGLRPEMEIIEPAEFAKSRYEYRGHPTDLTRTFSFEVSQPKVVPGSLFAQAKVFKEGRVLVVSVIDDGHGSLSVVCPGYGNRGGFGRVNYETGSVAIDLGSTPGHGENLVKPGEKNLVVTYLPKGLDRKLRHDRGRFSDQFLPNDVHIYRISKGGAGRPRSPSAPENLRAVVR